MPMLSSIGYISFAVLAAAHDNVGLVQTRISPTDEDIQEIVTEGVDSVFSGPGHSATSGDTDELQQKRENVETAAVPASGCEKYEGVLRTACNTCLSDDDGIYVCPSFADYRFAGTGNISYAETKLGGQEIAAWIGMYHTGILGRMDDGTSWTLQYYATAGFSNAVMPTIINGTAVYKNAAKIVFSNLINESYWEIYHPLHEGVSADILNNMLDFTVQYASNHTSYELFAVVPSDGQAFKQDQICDSFTRDYIYELKRQGVSMPARATLRYNSIMLVAESVSEVNSDNVSEMWEVANYFASLKTDLLANSVAAVFSDSLMNLVRFFASKPHVFAGSPTTGIIKATLVFPYIRYDGLLIDISSTSWYGRNTSHCSNTDGTKFSRDYPCKCGTKTCTSTPSTNDDKTVYDAAEVCNIAQNECISKTRSCHYKLPGTTFGVLHSDRYHSPKNCHEIERTWSDSCEACVSQFFDVWTRCVSYSGLTECQRDLR